MLSRNRMTSYQVLRNRIARGDFNPNHKFFMIPMNGYYDMDKDKHTYVDIIPFIVDIKRFGITLVQLATPSITYNMESMTHTVHFKGVYALKVKGRFSDRLKVFVRSLWGAPGGETDAGPSIVLQNLIVYDATAKELCFCIRHRNPFTLYIGYEYHLRYSHLSEY